MIEVNPGMDRTGAQLLRMVGEATQSRRLMHQVGVVVTTQLHEPGQPCYEDSATRVGYSRMHQVGVVVTTQLLEPGQPCYNMKIQQRV